MFGSPETQPGGRALKFYASQRLDIRRIETLKDGTEAVGNRVRVKVVKNKVAAPFRQAEFDIEFGKGISTSGCILDLGIEHSIVTKSGSFFSYGDERLGQGRNNAKAYLDTYPQVARRSVRRSTRCWGVSQDLVEADRKGCRPGGRRGPGGLSPRKPRAGPRTTSRRPAAPVSDASRRRRPAPASERRGSFGAGEMTPAPEGVRRRVALPGRARPYRGRDPAALRHQARGPGVRGGGRRRAARGRLHRHDAAFAGRFAEDR